MGNISAIAIQKAQQELQAGNVANATIFIDDYLANTIDNPVAWDIKSQIYYIEIMQGTRLFKDLYGLYKYIKADVLFVKEHEADVTTDELIAKTAVHVYEICCTLIDEHAKQKSENKKSLIGAFIIQLIGIALGTGHHRSERVLGRVLNHSANNSISKKQAQNHDIGFSNRILHQLKDDIKKFIPYCIDDERQKRYFSTGITNIDEKHKHQ